MAFAFTADPARYRLRLQGILKMPLCLQGCYAGCLLPKIRASFKQKRGPRAYITTPALLHFLMHAKRAQYHGMSKRAKAKRWCKDGFRVVREGTLKDLPDQAGAQVVARLLRIDLKTIKSWRDNGLPVLEHGRFVLIEREKLRQWLHENSKLNS